MDVEAGTGWAWVWGRGRDEGGMGVGVQVGPGCGSGIRQQGLKDPTATALWKSPGNPQSSSQPHRQCRRKRKPLSL